MIESVWLKLPANFQMTKDSRQRCASMTHVTHGIPPPLSGSREVVGGKNLRRHGKYELMMCVRNKLARAEVSPYLACSGRQTEISEVKIRDSMLVECESEEYYLRTGGKWLPYIETRVYTFCGAAQLRHEDNPYAPCPSYPNGASSLREAADDWWSVQQTKASLYRAGGN